MPRRSLWRVPRGVGSFCAVAFLMATSMYAFDLSGRQQAFVASYGHPLDMMANLAGFRLQSLEVQGLKRLSREHVLAQAGFAPTTSVLFMDAEAVRQRLLTLPLVESVRVRKVLPGSVVIVLHEREPYALWQHEGVVHVISQDGTVIDDVRDVAFDDLPFVVGEGAQKHVAAIEGLLKGYPALRSEVRAMVYVAQRRWNLVMKNGLVVRLAEDQPELSLQRLAELKASGRLLDRDVIAVDLRLHDRAIMRLSAEAAAQRRETADKIFKRKTS
jgi:cell division protein FtsQ